METDLAVILSGTLYSKVQIVDISPMCNKDQQRATVFREIMKLDYCYFIQIEMYYV